jgi:DNA (cytosine-5)-methyltransferase 1
MTFTFIDLFSGIGGFHVALKKLGGQCVFASEIDQNAVEVYKKNFQMEVHGDIAEIELSKIPYADLLAAGFPCQSFSKAGFQNGFNDKTKGTLFFNIKEILSYFVNKGKPIKYILLENVKNLTTHNKQDTWKTIISVLKDLGYIIHDYPTVMSPTDLEIPIPHSRDRVYIYGIHEKYNIKLPNIEFTRKNKNNSKLFSSDILEIEVEQQYLIDKDKIKIIEMWQELLDNIDFKPSFPVWGNYFRYPSNNPEHAPEWKLRIISRNQDFYQEHKHYIDEWAQKYDFWKLRPTFQKLEWQCQEDCKRLDETILQFRPSGLRAKRPTFIPTLVAISQVPVIYYQSNYRKLTPRECARLQSFPESFKISDNVTQAYKQFGNTVNVGVVEYIAKRLLEE